MEPSFLPLVSVIIPIYNGEADLPDLLAGLAAQTYPRDRVEYLLVDNGSRDRTPQLLQAAAANYAAEGVQIRYLSEAQIQSSYAARNHGIRTATSDILAFTDADCRPSPEWLVELVQPFTDATVGIVAGEILALPGNTVFESFSERRETLSQKHTLAHAFYPYGQTANLAVRRQAIAQAGLFRPYLTTGGDADLCWRIQQSGEWQIHFAEAAVVRHRHRASLHELKQQWQRYGRSNRYLHALHGVSLMREPTPREYLYRVGRWLLKELPTTAKQVVTRQCPASSLLDTPIELVCVSARAQGQRHAQLPEQARLIHWLSPDVPETTEERTVAEVSLFPHKSE